MPFRTNIDTERFTYLDKLGYVALVLGSTQFSLLSQLPQRIMLASKVVKIDSKMIVLLR